MVPENVCYRKNYLQVAPGPKQVLPRPQMLIFFQRILVTAMIENSCYPRSTKSYPTIFNHAKYHCSLNIF